MISIISSLYKSDRYLKRFQKALANFAQCLEKAGVDFEVIAIANEPTEKEKQLQKEFSGQAWFSFVSVGRESVFATFNRGVNLAGGEFLGFWNVDDIRYAQAVIEAVNLFSEGAELVHFPFLIKRYLNLGLFSLPLPTQKIDRQIPEFSASTKQQFLKGMVCGPFFMFTKSLYQKVGPFDEQFKIAGDFDWCARAVYKSEKFVKAKTLGGSFRVDGGGLSAGTNPRRVAENNIVYIRNRVWEKMQVAQDLIINEYRPKHMLLQGRYLPFSQSDGQ